MAADGMDWGGPRPLREEVRIEVEDGVTASFVAEQSLLAALLCRPSTFDALPEDFGPEHFVLQDHPEIFEATAEAAREAAGTGATHISPRVEALLPHLAGPGGYVRQLVGAVMGCSPGDVTLYARTLVEMSERRALIGLADDLRRMASDAASSRLPTPAIVARATDQLEQIQSGQRQAQPAMMLREAMLGAIRAGEAAAERGDGLSGLSTGYDCLDRRLGGLEGGSVYALAGRPGMGKTALGTDIGLRLAKLGKRVAMFSLEMKAEQIGRRALAAESGVPVMDIKTGRFATGQLETGEYMAQEIMRARERLADLPLLIEDEPSLSPAAISLRARAARRRLGGLHLLIIDHLHIMGAPAGIGRKDDTQIVTALSGGVKRLAKQMDVPVLLLAQLNRGAEGREDKRPGLADLRQSGAIEQDVDAALFIYRPEYYLAKQIPERKFGETDEAFSKREWDYRRMLEDMRGRAEILSEKVRDGEPGVDFLRFDGKRTRFFEEGEDRA